MNFKERLGEKARRKIDDAFSFETNMLVAGPCKTAAVLAQTSHVINNPRWAKHAA